MKPTHQLVTGEYVATAWQFNHKAPIPIWVAKKFHRIHEGDSVWQGIGGKNELILANPTDWAVLIEEKIIVVLTDNEFQKLFKPIPL